MIEFIKNLFKPKCHKWKTTHVNMWQHSTAEKCLLCDLKRDIESTSQFDCKWVYSDGTESEEFNHFTDNARVK